MKRLKRALIIALKAVVIAGAAACLIAAGFLSGWKSWSPEIERVERSVLAEKRPSLLTRQRRAATGSRSDLDSILEDAQAAVRFNDFLDLGEAKAFESIEALTGSELANAFKSVLAQPRTTSRDRLIDMILNRWARLDAPSAVAACVEAFHSDRESFLNRARTPFRYLAHHDPAAAFDAWREHWSSLDEGYDNSTEFELENLFQIWGKSDFDAAFKIVTESGANLTEDESLAVVSGLAKSTSIEHRDDMLAMVAETGDASLLAEARESIVEKMVLTGQISEAAHWIDRMEISAKERIPLENELAKSWFKQDQQAAAIWLLERSDDATRPDRLKELVRDWAEWEANAAGEWLGRMVEQYGQQADDAVSAFSRAIMSKDPEAAIQWLGSISDDTARLQAANRFGDAWARRFPDRPIDEIAGTSGLSERVLAALREGSGESSY